MAGCRWCERGSRTACAGTLACMRVGGAGCTGRRGHSMLPEPLFVCSGPARRVHVHDRGYSSSAHDAAGRCRTLRPTSSWATWSTRAPWARASCWAARRGARRRACRACWCAAWVPGLLTQHKGAGGDGLEGRRPRTGGRKVRQCRRRSCCEAAAWSPPERSWRAERRSCACASPSPSASLPPGIHPGRRCARALPRRAAGAAARR